MQPAASTLLRQLRLLEGCLGEEELSRLRSVVLDLAGQCPAAVTTLEATFRQAALSLPLVAQAIDSMPTTLASQRMGRRERDADTLVEQLCQSDQSSLEFSMPTRAVLSRALLLAKINFLKAVLYVLEEAGAEVRASVAVVAGLIGEAVFSKLAEELLCAATANPFNSMLLRRAAARKLVAIWDERRTLPVSMLSPILVSAWRARLKVRAVYGTLIGVSEVFSLIREECEPDFVNFFAREHVTDDEVEAFREFLFGLPFENLQLVRNHMQEHGLKVVSPKLVQKLVGSPQQSLPMGDPSPEQIYHSYWRRRIRAEYRVIMHSPGPRKTAEGYLMEMLLREEVGSVS